MTQATQTSKEEKRDPEIAKKFLYLFKKRFCEFV